MMNDPYLSNLLGKHEKIVLVTRQHWLVLVGEILSESVLTIALVVLVSLIWALWLPNPLIVLGYLLLVLPLVSLLRDVLSWTSRKYVVTSRRVIRISGVLSKDVTDSSLEKVNDVKMAQSFMGRLLDYGDIEILTASELGVNTFRRIGRPIRFKTAMLNAKESMGGGQGSTSGSEINVPGVLAQLEVLRRQGVLTDQEFQQKKAALLTKLQP